MIKFKQLLSKRIYREASDSTKWKQSLRKHGCLNPNHGKPRSEDVKQKISDSMKKYWQSVPSINDNNNDNKNNDR